MTDNATPNLTVLSRILRPLGICAFLLLATNGVSGLLYLGSGHFAGIFAGTTLPVLEVMPGRLPFGLICGAALAYSGWMWFHARKVPWKTGLVLLGLAQLLIGPVLLIDRVNGFLWSGIPPVAPWASVRLPQDSVVAPDCPALMVCFKSAYGDTRLYGGLLLHESLPDDLSIGPG